MREFDMKSKLLLNSFLLAFLPATLLAQGGFRKNVVATNGLVQSDTATVLVETAAQVAARIAANAPGFLTVVDSSVVTNGSLIDADIRVSTITGAKILDKTLRTVDINWAQQNADSVTSRVNTATPSAKGIWYLPPIQVDLDSANTLAGDTTWIWQNTLGVSITIDSTHVNASADDFVLNLVERNPNGGNTVLIDQVTASTNGTNTFYTTDSSVSAATIEAFHWIGFVRPTVAAETAYFRIHYH